MSTGLASTDVATTGEVSFGVGTTVSDRYTFTAENIRAYALMAQDPNPLHHDAAVAEASRFGGLIACAAQSTGMFTSLVASAFSPGGESVGLEFTHVLRRAVRAGTTATSTWTITARELSASPRGEIAIISGQMTDEAGRVLIEGHGRFLILSDKAGGP